MKGSKVLAELTLGLNVEVVLATEEDDTTKGNQTGDVILLGICEVGEVDTVNLSSDLWVIVIDIGSNGAQVLELRVAMQSLVLVRDFPDGVPVNVGETREQVVVRILLVVCNGGTSRLVVDQGLLSTSGLLGNNNVGCLLGGNGLF